MGFQLALNHKFASLQACQIENFIKQLLMPTRPNKNEIMGMHFFVDQILHNSLKRFACAAECLPKWLRKSFEIILDCEDRVVAAARMLFCLASLACFFACLETHCAASACSGNPIRGPPLTGFQNHQFVIETYTLTLSL